MSQKSSRSRVVVRQLGGPQPPRTASRKSTGLSRLKRSSYRQTRRRRRRTGAPDATTRSGRAASNRILVHWVAGVLIIFALGTGTMIMSLIGARRNSPPPFAPSLAAPSPTGALPLAPLGPEEAVQMARNLLTAASPRDIAALIRPGRVNPDQALAFLQTLPNTWDLERDIAWLGTYDTLSGSREVVAVRDRPQQPRLMPFVPDDEGLWKIDFDAFCGHCEVPLDQLAETKGQRSIVRTTFTQDHYFNGAFADETVWSCVELAHPDLERTYFAYYRKGSDQERTLDAILDRTENLSVSAAAAATGRRRSPVRVMLELDSTRGSTDGLFEIVSVVADGWVMPKQRLEVVLNQNETAAAP